MTFFLQLYVFWFHSFNEIWNEPPKGLARIEIAHFLCFFSNPERGIDFFSEQIHFAFHFVLWSKISFPADPIKNWQNEWCNTNNLNILKHWMREEKTKWPFRKRWIEELYSKFQNNNEYRQIQLMQCLRRKLQTQKNGNDAWTTQQYVIDEITLSFR